MGGYVALALAEKYPEFIEKLCLLNSTAQPDSEERKTLRDRAIQMAKTNYEALVSMSISNLFSSETSGEFTAEIADCKKEALKTPVQGYIACAEGMKRRKKREHVLQSDAYESLLITGKKDPVLVYENSIAEANRTQTPIVELSNGHMSHIENKKELLNSLRDFIRSNLIKIHLSLNEAKKMNDLDIRVFVGILATFITLLLRYLFFQLRLKIN